MENNRNHKEEKKAPSLAGMPALIVNIVLSIAAFILTIAGSANFTGTYLALALAAGIFYLSVVMPLGLKGLKVLKPNEAMVFTLFGQYHGCLKEPGFYFINPFAASVAPARQTSDSANKDALAAHKAGTGTIGSRQKGYALSLKAATLNNDKQKINDALGNPIVIGIVVIWKVVNPTKAVFNVDDYAEYLSIQCDSALRNIVRLYPYDSSDEESEKSLRGSSQEVADRLKEEIQDKVDLAGIEIQEARITHLSYAPEIAAAMLQKQQASAVIAARQMIVDGAVGMVQMALNRLGADGIVELDEERKAAMVSNLLVVLCSNRDIQPVVNSGSIY